MRNSEGSGQPARVQAGLDLHFSHLKYILVRSWYDERLIAAGQKSLMTVGNDKIIGKCINHCSRLFIN